jgi:hypothetical protein
VDIKIVESDEDNDPKRLSTLGRGFTQTAYTKPLQEGLQSKRFLGFLDSVIEEGSNPNTKNYDITMK